MILPLLILAAQVPSAPNNPSALHGSGSELVVQCLAAEAMAMEPVSVSSDQVEKGAFCIGYAEGYADGAKGHMCIPPRSLMAVIHSYLQYMRDNPKYYEMPRAAGLQAATDAAYPCRK